MIHQSVLESAKWIASQSQHVLISDAGIKRAADFVREKMKVLRYSCKMWKQHPLNPKDCSESTVDWIFLVDLLNFSFWSEHSANASRVFAVDYRGTTFNGYWSLCASVNRALDEGIPITDPNYFSKIDIDTLKHIFRPSDPNREQIPLISERLQVLHEAGEMLITKYNGTFVNCIKEADGSAQRLLDLITSNFSCFNDKGFYAGREVAFHKRAQILIADIWACFEGQGMGRFDDIDTITMFADYRVPQALCAIGALQYTKELFEELTKPETRLENGSEKEIEIRGCSIWAVELILRSILESDPSMASSINAITIDFFLWDYAKANSELLSKVPIHRTRSIFY